MKKTVTLFFFCALSCTAAHAAEAPKPPVTIGIMEEAHDSTPEKRLVRLMVGFVQTDEGWSAIKCENSATLFKSRRCSGDNFKKVMNWRAFYRDHIMGDFQTKKWLRNSKNDQHALRIVSSVPQRDGQRTLEFASRYNKPVYRPLVTTNIAWNNLKSQWKQDAADPAIAERVWHYFQERFPDYPFCDSQKNNPCLRKIEPSDMEFRPGFKSLSGERLLRVGRKRPPDSDFLFSSESDELWFHEDAQKNLRPLPNQSARGFYGFRPYLMPIDFGNYAGGEEEQAIFFIRMPSEIGYVLYYDHFTKFVTFTWHNQ